MVVEGTLEPLVDVETFRKVQILVWSRKQNAAKIELPKEAPSAARPEQRSWYSGF